MRILHLGKHYWPERGGIETASKQLADLGIELGAEVSCFVSARGPSTEEYVDQVKVLRYHAPFHLMSAPFVPELITADLSLYEIVHVHLPHPMAEIALLKIFFMRRKNRIRLLPYLHALPVGQGFIGRLWFTWITSRVLNRSEKILISNPKLLQAFPELPFWHKKFVILPFFTACLSVEEFQKDLPLRQKTKSVLALGRLVSYKGYDVLIKAWAKASEKGLAFSEFTLKICGEGPERNYLQSLIHEFGLSSKVELVGACSEQEKETLLRTSHFYVAPSTTDAETFGISILEALAHGLPVVTTTLKTGVSLLSRNGDCGEAVAPGSVPELAEALLRMTSLSPSEYAIFSKDNLDFARVNFSKAACKNVYEKLLSP